MKGKLLEEVQFLWSVVKEGREGQKVPQGGTLWKGELGQISVLKFFAAWKMEDFPETSG